MDKIFEMKLDAFGGVECFILGGVEYTRKEKPKPRTGSALRVDGKTVLYTADQNLLREDPGHSDMPDIVDDDGKFIGYVSIASGEVSIE